MQTILISIHLLVVIALVGVVLLQRSEGGALGIGGGQANALTRATAVLAAIFFITSLGLTILANVGRAPKSIFEGVAPAGQTAPGQPGGNVLDQLKQIEQNQQPAPAQPAAPEPPRQ